MKGSAQYWGGVRMLIAVAMSLSMVIGGIPSQTIAVATEELVQEEEAQKVGPSGEGQNGSTFSDRVKASVDEVSSRNLATLSASEILAASTESVDLTEHVRALFVSSVNIMAFPEQIDEESALAQVFGSIDDSAAAAGAFSEIVRKLDGDCVVIKSEVVDEGWCLIAVDGLWYHVDPWAAACELRKDNESELSTEDMTAKWLLAGNDVISAYDAKHATWQAAEDGVDVKTLDIALDSYQLSAIESGESANENVISSTGEQSGIDEGDFEISSDELMLSAQSTVEIASGTCGTCPWVLDSAGTLTIGAGKLWSHEVSNGWPWYDYRDRILAVKTLGTVQTDRRIAGLFYGCANLKTLDLSNWDTSLLLEPCSKNSSSPSTGYTYLSPFHGCSSLVTLNLSGWDVSKVRRADCLFQDLTALKTLNLNGWDTASLTSVHKMFDGCSSLESLDLSNWNTSSVVDMRYTFCDCSSLRSLDLSGWDTSSVNKFDFMFYGCSSLEDLDVSHFDTSSITGITDSIKQPGMSYMFSFCSSLETLDLSGFDVSTVEGMQGMFRDCSSLKSLDIGGWHTANLKDVNTMFLNCSSLSSLDLSSIDTSKVTSMTDMFKGCSSLSTVTLGEAFSFRGSSEQGLWLCELPRAAWRRQSDGELFGANGIPNNKADTYESEDGWSLSGTCIWAMSDGLLTVRPSDRVSGTLDNWFGYADAPWQTVKASMRSVVFEGKVYAQTAMAMFSGCSSLISLDLTGLDTSSVTDMREMFSGCSSLISLDLTGLDTSSVTDMREMFKNCSSLTRITVGNLWDVSGVTKSIDMFFNCTSLVG